MKKYLSDYLFLFFIAGVITTLDQWTKSLVRTNLAIGQTWVPWEWLAPYARIVHWKNSGAAFGMFQDLTIVFMILPFIVAGLIIIYFPQIPREDWPLRTALSLQMGGALGNLIDRLARGGEVTDFISVGRFPVFNVADSSISIGVAVLIIGMWIQERRLKATQAEEEESPPETELSPGVEEIIRE